MTEKEQSRSCTPHSLVTWFTMSWWGRRSFRMRTTNKLCINQPVMTITSIDIIRAWRVTYSSSHVAHHLVDSLHDLLLWGNDLSWKEDPTPHPDVDSMMKRVQNDLCCQGYKSKRLSYAPNVPSSILGRVLFCSLAPNVPSSVLNHVLFWSLATTMMAVGCHNLVPKGTKQTGKFPVSCSHSIDIIKDKMTWNACIFPKKSVRII